MEREISEKEEKEARELWNNLQAIFFCERDCPRKCFECLFYSVVEAKYRQDKKRSNIITHFLQGEMGYDFLYLRFIF